MIFADEAAALERQLRQLVNRSAGHVQVAINRATMAGATGEQMRKLRALHAEIVAETPILAPLPEP